MASALKLSNATVNAQADALSDLLDNGYIRIYSGTQPATADTALSGNTLLAELRAANPASGAAVAGVVTFSAVTSDTDADATGTASFYRTFKSDGTSVVMDGSVAATGGTADMLINSTAIQQHAQVDVTSWTHTVPKT